MKIWLRNCALGGDRRGAAAAELALILPLLIVLLFGGAEMGNYFLNQHVVEKAVRDGARYASRLPMSDYAGCAPTAAAQTKIRNVTRTSSVAGGTNGARLAYWQEVMGGNQTVNVSVNCNTSGTYSGIYHDLAMGAPVVQVRATVPYPPLFGMFGLINNSSFNLNATSQAAVMGI